MCGRYSLATSYEELHSFFRLTEGFVFKPRYNIAPAQTILTVLPGRKVRFMRWGFQPRWAKVDSPRHINARVESVREKRSFRNSFIERRCLIPATGYFEWQGEAKHKQPYYVRLTPPQLFAFAGIWDESAQEASVALLTKEADRSLQSLHERSPVVLLQEEYSAWLNEGRLVLSEREWHVYPVSSKINSPDFDTAAGLMALS